MSDYAHRREAYTATIMLSALPADVFPLFGPVEEAQWAEGWSPDVLYSSRPDAAELNAVFRTHHPGGTEAIWTVVHYDVANHAISYVRVRPDSHVARIDITCLLHGDGQTQATVTYTFTTLGPDGDDFLAHLTREAFVHHELPSWERAINHYLATEETLPHHA
jgi:hypothetical protein